MEKISGEICIGDRTYRGSIQVQRGVFKDTVSGVGALQRYRLIVRHFPFKRIRSEALFIGWIQAYREDFRSFLEKLEAESELGITSQKKPACGREREERNSKEV